MKERFVTILVAAIVGVAALFMLPGEVAVRVSDGLRFVTKPAQTWSDWAARVARAAVGGKSADEDPAAQLAQTQAELAQFRLEYQAATAAQAQMAHDLQVLGAAQDAYPSRYAVAFAKVVKRDPLQSYYDQVMIDKGATDGLKVGQYVAEMPMAIPGYANAQEPCLLGVVEQVAATSAMVRLLSNPYVCIPCGVPGRTMSGVLCGMKHEYSDGLALEAPPMQLVIANPMGREYSAVADGDHVFTSGMGEGDDGMANILVGVVTESKVREDGMPLIMVRPMASLWDFTHVMVILGKPSSKRR